MTTATAPITQKRLATIQSAKRLKNLHLAMTTNFAEINIPPFAESPTSRAVEGEGRKMQWDYTDVIGANAIAMDMPAVTNPGYVAGRMTFFAPVSLLFFFAVLVIVARRMFFFWHDWLL